MVVVRFVATSIGMCTTNYTLLYAMALFAGQGIVGAAIIAIMAVCGAVCASEVIKQSHGALKVQKADKICTALCFPRLASGVLQTPLLMHYISSVNLATIGYVLGEAVNAISSVSLMRDNSAQ